MFTVSQCPLPDTALILRHADRPGCLHDCFRASLLRPVSLPDLIEAFYTSRAFAPEALILRLTTGCDTGRDAARAIAEGQSDRFVMWQVEDRSETQLLMAVGSGPIRSWWMVEPQEDGTTKLYFGSAILPRPGPDPKATVLFRATHWLHKLYARTLLAGTVKTLRAPAGMAEAR